MKFLIILIVLNLAFLNLKANEIEQWENFKKEYGKNYSPEEDEIRKEIFLKALHEIEEHNGKYKAGIVTFEMSINEFADLTDDEYQSQIANGKAIPSEEWESLPQINITARSLPNMVNWVDFGFRNPVINQGSCGSCYAMASTAAVEGHYFIKYKQLIQLSQQEIVDCSSNYGNKGCQYGFMHATLNYIKDNGVGAAAGNPYRGVVGQCRYSNPRYYINNWYRTAQNDEYALMQALTVGPVVVLINAGLNSFKYYNGGLYYDANCYLNPSGINHFVTVVGYGVNNANQPYWVFKNSWGSNWGSGGYMYMARHANNQCGIAFQPMYPQIR
ncbi:procathepsin L-like [Condylostylus longicornis]|uniref:procathepsin L-like n=1 Tax=Condylostylus longicornis TaxID=2530218 RepID=UPI00244DB667|nr:procathepsin L-like [Condylostylus longicornis]